ncbi:hypothetical protein PHMEG_00032820 [Phytophthora megakarya]|uniref:Retrotransposon gag domain-containing protein n=1 Tax=Phytophthora megakarya TaxID=4795 RepID=A0A225UU44_9STRA|nr:hypothetical protein PHMEG_00032820 [Phytophthora megakarya]
MPVGPSQVRLPQTPVKQNESSTSVFGSKGSLYMHDSHMVIPRSASRQDRIVKENEALRPTPNTYKGPTQQPDRRYDLNEDSSDDGKDLLDLSLQDGALHWYRQLPRKARWTWKLLSDAFIKYYCSKINQSAKARYYCAKREDKEHVCDYLNRLNGYARNAGVQFENGGREAKDHVEHFLDMGSEYDYAGEDERGHVAAANDHERRTAAEGTFARFDNRRSKGDSHFNNDRRENRNGRQQYGPCAACGGLTHSCEAFNELASLLRSKVDKNDLTPMLQSVLAEPAVDADYLFAFTGEVKWPEDREMGFVDTTEIVEGNDRSLDENEVGEMEAHTMGI